MKRFWLTFSVLALILSAMSAQAQGVDCKNPTATNLLDMNFLFSCNINKFVWLDKETDALQARLDMIQQAQKEITAEYFDVGEDIVSYTGLGLLRQAARRGIKVRVIIDSLSSGVSRATLVALASDEQSHGNLQIRLFNRVNLNDPKLMGLTNRDHTKLFIADKQFMVGGGRNITCQYFYLCNDKTTFTDLDGMVAGPLAAAAQEENFDKLWLNGKALTPLSFDAGQSANNKKVQKAAALMDDSIAKLDGAKFPVVRSNTGNVWLQKMIVINNAKFLHDDPTQDPTIMRNNSAAERQLITPELISVIGSAQHTLTIQTPYLYPDEDMQKLFAYLINKRHVHVKILTNSLHSTDNLLVQAGYRSVRDQLIKIGIELYEFRGPRTAHAKTAVIDGHIVIIGSFNLDPRSANLNREVAIVGDSEELGAQLTKIIHDKFENNATLIGIAGQPVGTPAHWDAGVPERKIIAVDELQKHFLRFIKGAI